MRQVIHFCSHYSTFIMCDMPSALRLSGMLRRKKTTQQASRPRRRRFEAFTTDVKIIIRLIRRRAALLPTAVAQ